MSSFGTSKLKNFKEYTTTMKNSMIRIVLMTRETKNMSGYIPSASIFITIKMLESTGSLKIVFDKTMKSDNPFKM